MCVFILLYLFVCVCVGLYTVYIYIHSKNAGLIQPKFGSNMDKPKCWVKNIIKKCTVES